MLDLSLTYIYVVSYIFAAGWHYVDQVKEYFVALFDMAGSILEPIYKITKRIAITAFTVFRLPNTRSKKHTKVIIATMDGCLRCLDWDVSQHSEPPLLVLHPMGRQVSCLTPLSSDSFIVGFENGDIAIFSIMDACIVP